MDQYTVTDIYRTLPAAKSHRLKFTSDAPFIPTYVEEQLSKKHVNHSTIYASRVKSRHILLDNPIKESKRRKAQNEKKRRVQVAKEKKVARGDIIGTREAKKRRLWNFNESQAKFDLFLPLHRMWQGYMSELLQLPARPNISSSSTASYIPNSASMHAKLVKADYHGAYVTVSDAKNPALINLSGIVIHETQNALRVVTKLDVIKLLPKQNSIFTFGVPLHSILTDPPNTKEPVTPDVSSSKHTVLDAPHLLFTLYGNQLRFRAAERAGKKFKAKMTIEL